MKVEMSKELWNAVIVAIDNDLNDYHSMGTEGDPELDIRYGKMLQARGEILLEMKENNNGKGRGNITEYKLFQDLHQMVSGTDVTYKQVDSDLDEEGDVTVFFSNVKGGGNE